MYVKKNPTTVKLKWVTRRSQCCKIYCDDVKSLECTDTTSNIRTLINSSSIQLQKFCFSIKKFVNIKAVNNRQRDSRRRLA